MNNFKQPVYFHERKLKAPQKVQIRNSMSNMYSKLPGPFQLCFQRNAPLQFEECNIPGKNTFLNPYFYSVQYYAYAGSTYTIKVYTIHIAFTVEIGCAKTLEAVDCGPLVDFSLNRVPTTHHFQKVSRGLQCLSSD